MYFVYLFRCKDGSLYCGTTSDLAARETMHNSGKGSKYVKSRGGGTMAYYEEFSDKNAALKREAAIKRLSKDSKESLTAVRSR